MPEPTPRRTPDGASAYTWRYASIAGCGGLSECCRGTGTGSAEERFLAACARGDEAGPAGFKSDRPDLPAALSEAQLRLLPELAAQGCNAAVMRWLSWLADRDPRRRLDASALNLAVFRGDAELTRFLLEHGASWTEQHGHGDNVCGTFLGPRAMIRSRTELAGLRRGPCRPWLTGRRGRLQGGEGVIVDGRRKWFTEEVTDFLLGARQHSLSAKA